MNLCPPTSLVVSRAFSQTVEAMNFCATEGIEIWLAGVLNDPRGAGFAKRLLLQDGFIALWQTWLVWRTWAWRPGVIFC